MRWTISRRSSWSPLQVHVASALHAVEDAHGAAADVAHNPAGRPAARLVDVDQAAAEFRLEDPGHDQRGRHQRGSRVGRERREAPDDAGEQRLGRLEGGGLQQALRRIEQEPAAFVVTQMVAARDLAAGIEQPALARDLVGRDVRAVRAAGDEERGDEAVREARPDRLERRQRRFPARGIGRHEGQQDVAARDGAEVVLGIETAGGAEFGREFADGQRRQGPAAVHAGAPCSVVAMAVRAR